MKYGYAIHSMFSCILSRLVYIITFGTEFGMQYILESLNFNWNYGNSYVRSYFPF